MYDLKRLISIFLTELNYGLISSEALKNLKTGVEKGKENE